MARKLKAPIGKQAKSLTIKASWGGIGIAAVGLGIAVEQLTGIIQEHGVAMFSARTMGYVMLALSLAKLLSSGLTWYGRYRIMGEPPAETPREEKM
jgi:hypothetical protein